MQKRKSVVLFGDSLLGRFGKSLIQQLENKLENTTVYNCAAGGLNTEDGVERADFISQLRPNYVVISFGANDCAPWKEQIPLEKFENNLQRIVESFSQAKVVMFLCPSASDFDDKEGTAQFNDLLQRYNDCATQVAIKNGASVIDSQRTYGELLKSGNDYHVGDGIHLNEVGYDILIEELVRLIA